MYGRLERNKERNYVFVQGLANVLVRGLVKFVPLHLTTAKFHKTYTVFEIVTSKMLNTIHGDMPKQE